MKKGHLIVLLCSLFLIYSQCSIGQNNRINTSNSIGWYNYFGTFKLSSKFGAHTEYQWRRNNLITDWQQSLLRVGINYNKSSSVLFRIGYAWVETYPYGEFPINGLGREFTEHRIFQMAQVSHKEGAVDLSHRFMLEQRFAGKYTSADMLKEDEYPLLHRARYMFKLQSPINKNKSLYAAVYDEVFIGFGKNVNANVFDQNRIGVLLGFKFNKNAKIEAGYLNQTLQLGRLVDGQNVFQNNNGLIINSIFNIDFTKKSKE